MLAGNNSLRLCISLIAGVDNLIQSKREYFCRARLRECKLVELMASCVVVAEMLYDVVQSKKDRERCLSGKLLCWYGE